MNKLNARQTWAGALFGVVALVAASCTVDTSKITFVPDDEFNGSGGNSSASGGTGQGGQGGDAAGTGGATGTCTAGKLTCAGQQVQICTGTDLIDVGGSCPFACVDGLCTGACVPGGQQCVSNGAYQSCSTAGEWSEPVGCVNKACIEEACVGDCSPSTYRCGGAASALPQRCNDQGAWEDLNGGLDCAGGADNCMNGVCTGACTEGVDQCTGGPGSTTWEKCIGGDWQSQTACAYVCNASESCTGGGACPCQGTCTPGTTTCANGTQEQLCNNSGSFGAPYSCPFVCAGGAGGQCGGVCTPGATRCDGSVVQTCSASAAWTKSVDCADNAEASACVIVGSQAQCGGCKPGATRCDGNVLEVCAQDSATWLKNQCAPGNVCNGIKGGFGCVKLLSSMCSARPTLTTCLDTNTAEKCKGLGLVFDECGILEECRPRTGQCTSGRF